MALEKLDLGQGVKRGAKRGCPAYWLPLTLVYVYEWTWRHYDHVHAEEEL
jgi:hypothetical protein